jgi:hypothetical protein
MLTSPRKKRQIVFQFGTEGRLIEIWGSVALGMRCLSVADLVSVDPVVGVTNYVARILLTLAVNRE